jgi:hypothetical protein
LVWRVITAISERSERTMNLVMLATLAVTSQTMQFRNDAYENVTIQVYCFQHRGMANNNEMIVLRPGATGSFRLSHVGNYQVIARSPSGGMDRNNRVMSQGELDRMVVGQTTSNPPPPIGRRAYKPPPPRLRILEYYPPLDTEFDEE